MVSVKTSALAAVVNVLSWTTPADAFWRMPCRSRTGLARLDPLVNPGGLADHAHAIHGGGNFGMNAKATDLKYSKCTSCAVTQDKSAYWTPSLHFMYPNGTTVLVPQTGGMLAYYMLNPDGWTGTGKITAFPDGFQMLAGDKGLRNFSYPVPDPPLNQWTGSQGTQDALRQKALGFNCLNYQRAPEPSLYRHSMPDKAYLDANCANGVRAELMFPSCWNGKDLDSTDHRSHVAYPSFVMTGACPDGYKTKLPSLFYETIWWTPAFAGVDGQFVWSTGDPTGYGYHGDFMMGWDSVDFLQQAVDTCTNLSGNIQDCSIFDIQSDYSAADCSFKVPELVANDNIEGPRQGLPVDVPVQPGPGYATNYKVVGQATAIATVASSAPPTPSLPLVTYSARASSATIPGGPAPTTPAQAASSSQPVKIVAATASTSSKMTSSTTGAAITTPAPAVSVGQLPPKSMETIGTSYITKPNEVIEVVLVQTYVTVTATVPYSDPGNWKARRHLKDHQRRMHG